MQSGRQLAHVERPVAVALRQLAEAVEDPSQDGKVLVGVGGEVVRMPPQVEHLAPPGGPLRLADRMPRLTP